MLWSILNTKSYYSCLSALVHTIWFYSSCRGYMPRKKSHWHNKNDRYRPIFMKKTPSLFRDKKPFCSSRRRKGWKAHNSWEHWGAHEQEVLLCAFLYWLNCENVRKKCKTLLLHHHWNNAKDFGPHHLFLHDAANGYYRPSKSCFSKKRYERTYVILKAKKISRQTIVNW